MILRRRHEHDSLAIAKGETGCFRAGHEGFNDAGVAGGAEGFVGHDFVYCGDRFGLGCGEEDSLSGGEAGGFDYLVIGGVEGLDVGDGCFGASEVLVFGGGDGVLLEKIFGECLFMVEVVSWEKYC